MPKRTDIHKIMVIGSGPIVIGQAAEFDYAGTQACLALKEEGYVSIPLGVPLGNVDDMVFATKGDEGILILYFKESADAKEFYESDEAKSLKEEFFDENESLVFKRQGKIVYIGTEAAVKAAR